MKKKDIVINQNENRIVSPFDFNPCLPKFNKIFKKHHKAFIYTNPELSKHFEHPPMVAYRQPQNIKQILCKSSLIAIKSKVRFKRGTHYDAPGWKNCKKPCPICPMTLQACKEIKSENTGYTHKIIDSVNCQSENLIYYWKCTKENCPNKPYCEYIGKTKRKFQIRFSEHRDYAKSLKINEPSGEHFNKSGHSVHNLKGMVLEKVKSTDPFVLKIREARLIRKFDTYHHGLNKCP